MERRKEKNTLTKLQKAARNRIFRRVFSLYEF